MKAKLTGVVVGLFLGLLFSGVAEAQSSLTVEPITWDVIGLDSNAPTAGPKYFPVGVRITNNSVSTSGVLTATFVWDSSNSYINPRPNTLSTLDLGTLAGNGGWVDAYFEVEVTQDTAAYEASRSYHISVAEGGTWNANSPIRALYVEHLVSQGRNDVTNMYLSVTEPPTEGPYGTEIPNGGSMTLMVGNTYWITLEAYTATNGYEQLESFINFPNIIFQILDVTTTYTADSSTNVENPSDKLYGDGCVWDSDPTSPNYLSCLSTGKVGGDLITIYEVKILQIPDAPRTNPEPLTTLIYDFSGSSYHYNSDFGGSTRYATIVNAGIEKSFSPSFLNPNATPVGTSTLTFTITNPGSEAITDVSFYDDLPDNGGTGQMSLTSTTFTYGGFTVNPTPDPLMTVGGTWLSFTGATVPGLSSATIAVTVTTDEIGIYHNVSDNLIINTDIDTGDYAEDTLVATDRPTGSSTCDPRVTLATWEMPTTGQGSGGPPPPYTTLAPDVDEITTYASSSGGTASISTTGNPANSWEILNWLGLPDPPSATTTPYFEFTVDTRNYNGVAISFTPYIYGAGDWASAGTNNKVYVHSRADSGSWSTSTGVEVAKQKWPNPPITYAAPTTGFNTTTFRINFVGARTASAAALIDNIIIDGCPVILPTLTKSFSDESICRGDSSELTFTVTNPTSITLNGLGFTDTLPAGLVVATPNGLTGGCGSGTITAVAGTNTISLSGASLDPGISCTFSVDVTGTVAGIYTNTTGSISSTETGANTTPTGYGTDDLTVVAPPVIIKTFGTSNLITGSSTSLTFAINNPNSATSLTGVGFTDTLPAGLDVTSATVNLPCSDSGTLTLTDNNPNPDTIVLSDASLDPGESCTFSVTVTGTTAGTYENTVQVTSTNGCTGNTASATVFVRDLISSIALQKKVGMSSTGPWYDYMSAPINTPLYYQFLVENTGETELTGVEVTDPILNPTDPHTVCTFPSPIPVADAFDDGHIVTCTFPSSPSTILALLGEHTNWATVTADGGLEDSDDATYYGQNPTAVVIGRVALGYARVTDFLRSIGVPDLGIAELQNLLRVWAPDSPAWESADRQELLDALMAYLDPDGDGRVVVFRWETLEERGTIGFFAERLTNGAWVRINAGMLPGLIASPMGAEYWLADPGASPGNDYVYRLIEVEARGTTREYGPFDLRVDTPLQ